MNKKITFGLVGLTMLCTNSFANYAQNEHLRRAQEFEVFKHDCAEQRKQDAYQEKEMETDNRLLALENHPQVSQVKTQPSNKRFLTISKTSDATIIIDLLIIGGVIIGCSKLRKKNKLTSINRS